MKNVATVERCNKYSYQYTQYYKCEFSLYASKSTCFFGLGIRAASYDTVNINRLIYNTHLMSCYKIVIVQGIK